MATYIMECGGMERIEQLQMHDNNNIYNKVGIQLPCYVSTEYSYYFASCCFSEGPS